MSVLTKCLFGKMAITKYDIKEQKRNQFLTKEKVVFLDS